MPLPVHHFIWPVLNNSSSLCQVEGNQIYNLTQTNATGGAVQYGIFVATATAGFVRNNKIYNITGIMLTLLRYL
jgi:hypothetical protein